MRNFRTFNNTPVGNDPSATDYIGAININNFLSELEASVSRSGQTLSVDDGAADPDTTQLAKSLFIHAAKATAFQAAGSANAIELTPVSGASGVLLPPDYTLLSGARFVFAPTAANTGAVTVNIGQTSGTLLGAKALLNSSGSALTGGELTAGQSIEIQYNGTEFEILPWSEQASPVSVTLQNIRRITASGTWSKPAGLSYVVVEVWGGGGGGAGGYATNALSGSGGGGGYSQKKIVAADLGITETVTIGAAGTAGGIGGAGGAGGASSFGSHCSATGGGGGIHYTTSTVNAGAGGVGLSGDINLSGCSGTYGSGTANLDNGLGGSAPRGGCGGMVQVVGAAVGVVGSAPGGGGSSGRGSGSVGGAGAQGWVVVYEYGV